MNLQACRMALFGALLALHGAARSEATASPEYALKAAFIYNFAKFTTWSERADHTITLCIVGRDPFGAAIEPLEGKEIGMAKLTIRHTKSVGEALRSCQIVFLAESEVDNFLARSDSFRESGVLTIADKEGAARQGVMIELTPEDKKIGFEFNQEAARVGHVQISSKLLRIARKVY